MTEITKLESRIGKPISERNKEDIQKLYSDNVEEMRYFNILSEVISRNKNEDVYLLIAPRIQQILFNDALQKCTNLLEKYKNKSNKESAEKLKSELLNVVENDRNYFYRLLTLGLALRYFKSVDKFKLDYIQEVMNLAVKSTLSINFIDHLELCSEIMTEIIYPARISYFKSFGVDLFTKELLGIINKYEEYLNLLAEKISSGIKESTEEHHK